MTIPVAVAVAPVVSDVVSEIVSDFTDPPEDPHAPLDLESLVVVQLVEALEERFDFTARAAELIPENLATLAALGAWVARRTAAAVPESSKS